MTEYIPQANDIIKWPRRDRPSLGTVKGVVIEVDLNKEEAIVTTLPSKYQAADKNGARRTRFSKAFDQLTLLERPGVDT